MTDFGALLAALGRHEVAFIVVGGAAAIAHGSAEPVAFASAFRNSNGQSARLGVRRTWRR
jgi:hypothetical protein